MKFNYEWILIMVACSALEDSVTHFWGELVKKVKRCFYEMDAFSSIETSQIVLCIILIIFGRNNSTNRYFSLLETVFSYENDENQS